MVKLTKEYSDAFGFRLLGHFTSFLAEHPEKGSQIQNICDEDFKATCIKCYPIILSTGVDPAKYIPPVLAASVSLRTTLREMFPLETIDLTESEDEAPPSPELLKCPANSPKKKKPESPKKEPLLKTIDVSCSKCSQLTTINNNLLKDLALSTQNEQKYQLENHNLRKALANKDVELKKLQAQLTSVRNAYTKLTLEIQPIREDPGYSDLKQFYEFKRKRK